MHQNRFAFSRLPFCLAVIGIVQWAIPWADADIIVDDFNVPGLVSDPGDGYFLEQHGHGPDGALRFLSVRYGFPENGGMTVMDSNITLPSVLHGELNDPPLFSGGSDEYAQFGVAYSLFGLTPSTWDWSENGKNDTFFLDFAYVRGPGRIGGIKFSIWSPDFNVFRDLFDIPISETPYSLAVPLSWIAGPNSPPRTLERVEQFAFEIRSSGFSHYPYFENYSWQFGIDRVRVGQLAPEPASSVLLIAGAFVGWSRRYQLGKRK